MHSHRIAFAFALLAACAAPSDGPRTHAFREAARDHAIPEDWLVAIGFSQSRLEVDTASAPDDPDEIGDAELAADTTVDEADQGTETDASPDGDHSNLPPAWGIMQLADAQVERAAELTGATVDAIRNDLAANIDAAAALIADARDTRGLSLRDATAELLGVAGDDETTELALGDLDATVAAGFDVTTADGERVVLDGAAAALIAPVAPGHYPPRQWIASPNYSSRLGYGIRYIVVHDIEGTMAGAIAVFKKSSSQASAHYIVRSHDGHVVQMVREADNAWHAGHGWFNRHSIGIEHEGFAHKKAGGGFYNETQYKASAALACAIAHRYGIPVDRKHVFGHFNVPSSLASHTLCSDARGIAGECGGVSHHSDPGRYWKWNHYVQLIKDCVAAAT